MSDLKRLTRIEALSHAQEKTLREIQGGQGLCTCGRQFSPLSPKFVLANAVTQHPTDKNLRACLVMGAFCLSCFTSINNLLGMLKGSNKKELNG